MVQKVRALVTPLLSVTAECFKTIPEVLGGEKETH